jgi:4-hydroxy-tetrahydrodipicolinate synthase
MANELKGVYVIALTPLDGKRQLDLQSFENLIDYYLEAGVDGFTVLGEVSEAGKLSKNEQQQIVETAIARVGGKVPVVVGISRESTDLVIDAAGWAEDLGASGFMVAPPKNLKMRDDAMFGHYAALGDAVSLPLVVQDEPESNHPLMSAELLARIFKDVPRAKYLKLEDPPTPAKILRLRELTDDRIKIFGGTHGRWFLWELDSGSVGIMTGSPTPEYLVQIWKEHRRGQRDKARQIFFYNQALTWFYPEMAVAVKKEVLVQRGVIKTALLKQPAAEFSDLERKELVEVLEWVEEKIQTNAGVSPLRRSAPEPAKRRR